jgi:hypothetical protein
MRGAKNDTTAAIFLLKSHRREIYGDKFAHELTGANGAPLLVTIIRDHPPVPSPEEPK